MRRAGPFDVVHGYLALPAGIAAALAGRRLGVPAVVTFDSGEFVALPEVGAGYGLQLRMRHRLAVAAAARLARCVTVCSGYQERLARAHGVAPTVVPIGVDAARFTPPSQRLDGPPWRLLHVASQNPVKDQATLLQAVNVLVSQSIDVRLDLVGEDTMGGEVASLARRLDLTARVTFHGFQPTDVLSGLYQRAHLFVLSSRHEGANVSVLEAAASGLPTVGTAVGYLADWAPQRAAAVATGDATSLADAVARLLADAPLRRQLASAAREWTIAHDADWTARQFEAIYERLTEHSETTA
jgi:glycosyltransferase involved in cell wall biosynthesis